MRFRFCGDLDCPDWVLAEIQTLSKLSSIKFKLLCAQVAKSLVGASTSAVGEVSEDALDIPKIEKLCSDAKLEWNDVKAAVAALHYILTNSAKHGVKIEELSDEIQQLGLPKEHATGLGKVYSDHSTAVRSRLKEKGLKLNCLEKVDWRVDYVLGSSAEPEASQPEVHMRLNLRDADSDALTPLGFSMDPDQCRLLLKELTAAEQIMSKVSLKPVDP